MTGSEFPEFSTVHDLYVEAARNEVQQAAEALASGRQHPLAAIEGVDEAVERLRARRQEGGE